MRIKYIVLLFITGTIIMCDAKPRFSLSDINFSLIYDRCIDVLSSPVIMHITCWLMGDKLIYGAIKFPSNKIAIKVVIALATVSIADIARRNINNIKENRWFKKMTPELKIATAYSLATIGYATAASIPIPASLKYYNKGNIFQLASGFLITQSIPNFK